MRSIPVTQEKTKICELLDCAAFTREPFQITRRRCNAVLLSEEDWRGIQETLFLLPVPGMRESIRTGLGEAIAQEFVFSAGSPETLGERIGARGKRGAAPCIDRFSGSHSCETVFLLSNSEAGRIIEPVKSICCTLCLESNSEAGRIQKGRTETTCGLCLESNSEAGRMSGRRGWWRLQLCLESNSEAGRITDRQRFVVCSLCLESNSEAGRIPKLAVCPQYGFALSPIQRQAESDWFTEPN
jgi:antitoxin YefM